MLWKVEMTKQTKITVIVILGLGVLYGFSRSHPLSFWTSADPSSASVATLIRLRFLADLEETDDILCPSQLPPVSALVS